MFKERIREALTSSSPTTPTPPTRIRRGKPRVQREVQESSAGPSSSSTPTPPSSPTSRNIRALGEEEVFPESDVCPTLVTWMNLFGFEDHPVVVLEAHVPCFVA